ncbi:hypothetical protein LY28_00863 [Ruminiclostridium sufflavum DSM 19573]|uniref:Uncharacterized protein n=1 Tax=Ruminiclostridium sufflavum DSM 19573 TaxID=1121337 RepID=A0A318XMF8_9FIRM|nr:hypothetical protein [Ruminiclostridium sufflavum]PYG89042.1 hypothetical protein LY28_00863 [Ruminiclostridium sufflavum DSM 19573]
MLLIDGGTFWGKVSSAAAVVAGVALVLVPEPTTATKFAGGAAIVAGVAAIGGGVASFAMN